jgi:hypothetical protein
MPVPEGWLMGWEGPVPDGKGEPSQITYHSVTAPPVLFKQLTLINLSRKS